jgi:tripartite-type tricarboxylate transporter receptor subunit TctC
MKVARRQFLRSAAGVATLPALARFSTRFSWAQSYPTRPVRIIVGVPPGGPLNLSARLLGQWLSERLGQQFIIENRPGAGSNIATEAVARATPDGYTLLLVYTSAAINPSMFIRLDNDFLRDIAPVASINRIPLALAVHPTFAARTIPELIAYAKANPGKLSIATPGKGTGPHLAAELLKIMGGIDIVHVPYRGSSPMMPDLLSGQVPVAFDALSSFIEFIRAGRLRALAVTTAMRLDTLPDVPTIGESVPGFEASGWCGLGAPASTPAEIVARLNQEINAGLEDPRIKARLADVGDSVLAGSPADFGRLIAADTEKWSKVVKSAGIKPE